MTSKVVISIIITLLFVSSSLGQRTFEQPENERERKPKPEDIGEFPFHRGETPIFNFDEGDEPFLNTIGDLVKGVHQMANIVTKQKKVTTAFGQGISQCEDCKF